MISLESQFAVDTHWPFENDRDKWTTAIALTWDGEKLSVVTSDPVDSSSILYGKLVYHYKYMIPDPRKVVVQMEFEYYHKKRIELIRCTSCRQ